MANKQIETDSKGIPLKSPNPEGVPLPLMYGILNTVFGAIGYAAARFWAYSVSNQEAADSKIQILAQYDLGWLYLGVLVLRILQLPIGVMLGMARGKAKIHVPNQQVYKVQGAAGANLGYVLMENEGALGEFNRAQRAWQNYLEQFASFLMYYVAASWVFPFESFVCAAIFSVAKIMSASGYQTYVEGRLGGLMIGAIASSVLQGMILIVILKTLM